VTATARPTVGILHPGRMGGGIAAQAVANSAAVLWVPTGRSEATAARAAAGGLTPVPTVAELVQRADIILSICPPMFAEAVAAELGEHDVAGKILVEANPVTSRQLDRIAEKLPGATLIDGAIIGSVPGGGKKPALYIAGPTEASAALQVLFAGTDVIVRDLGSKLGKASALKSAYSTFQKGSRVLAALAHALGDEHGVKDELLELALQRSGSYLSEPDYVSEMAAIAWRWSPDLTVAAAELNEAGYPGHAINALADVLGAWNATRNNWNLTPHEATEVLRTGYASNAREESAGVPTVPEPL
jgi:3-hydroxyisobutyrate dehydrogenase-like beta-hydroxyacid dehydrogenase